MLQKMILLAGVVMTGSPSTFNGIVVEADWFGINAGTPSDKGLAGTRAKLC
jgi:hypothetical protein